MNDDICDGDGQYSYKNAFRLLINDIAHTIFSALHSTSLYLTMKEDAKIPMEIYTIMEIHMPYSVTTVLVVWGQSLVLLQLAIQIPTTLRREGRTYRLE